MSWVIQVQKLADVLIDIMQLLWWTNFFFNMIHWLWWLHRNIIILSIINNIFYILVKLYSGICFYVVLQFFRDKKWSYDQKIIKCSSFCFNIFTFTFILFFSQEFHFSSLPPYEYHYKLATCVHEIMCACAFSQIINKKWNKTAQYSFSYSQL